MNYEQKMRTLKWVKPEKKDMILARIIKGEKSVDITSDEDIFFQLNVDRMSMDKVMDRNRYKDIAKHAKHSKDVQKNGRTLRYKGEIPLNIWLTHPWFSPLLDKKERDANIERFFKLFPAFKGE